MKHSVILEYQRCRGCTTCIKNCPTEAIRVRNGKAMILSDRCIDCGKCIQVCPHKAIKSVGDTLDRMEEFKYCVALPDPSLYGQFQHLDDVNVILTALLEMGFDHVFETARAGEILADYMRQCIAAGSLKIKPQISSACPAILRLIRLRFPKLIPNVAQIPSPLELAAVMARQEAVEETGLRPEEIGIFAIVPCSCEVTAAQAAGASQQSIDVCLAARDVYLKLLEPMKACKEVKPLASAGIMGVGWAYVGGESASRLNESYVAVDGIENCIRMLEEIEDGRLPEADFIELNACVQGCVGGCFNVENPYGARMRIKKLMRDRPKSCNRYDETQLSRDVLQGRELQYIPALLLDEDRSAAMEKLMKIEALEHTLPGLDCGSCGAPSCHALAEDVILGRASEEDCIFRVRERARDMAGGGDADEYLPPPFRHTLKRAQDGGPQQEGKHEGGTDQ